MLSGRSRSAAISRSSTSPSINHSTNSQSRRRSSDFDFSHELESGVSVVIAREEYERIRRTVDEVEEKCPRMQVIGGGGGDSQPISDQDERKSPISRRRATSCPPISRRRPSSDQNVAVGADEQNKSTNAELHKKLEKFRQEQDVEIRRLNEMITEAKCLATREAQILDKHRRNNEEKMTELQLDKNLEEHGRDLDRRTKEFRSKRNLINLSYAGMIRQQIDANEALRKNAERTMRNWEAKLNERRMDNFRRDQADERAKKLEQQRQLREGLEACIVERKKLDEQRRTDEAEIRRKMEKYAAERAAWRLSLQEADAKKAAAMERLHSAVVVDLLGVDACDVERNQAVKTRHIREELDRDWRLRQVNMEADRREARHRLAEAREEQMACKKRDAAEEASRQRQQHERLLELERQATEAHRDTELKRKQRSLEYGEYVRRQISEKQERTRREKEDRLLEANLVKKANSEHDKKLMEVKLNKLQALKCQEIPSRYVMEVARKSRVPWTASGGFGALHH